jgi:hypothetical protein
MSHVFLRPILRSLRDIKINPDDMNRVEKATVMATLVDIQWECLEMIQDILNTEEQYT